MNGFGGRFKHIFAHLLSYLSSVMSKNVGHMIFEHFFFFSTFPVFEKIGNNRKKKKKKMIFDHFLLFSTFPVIEKVGNDHFRILLSRESENSQNSPK